MVEIRFLDSGDDDEVAAFGQAIARGFGEDQSTEDADGAVERFRSIFAPDGSIVAVDDGRFVATFASYDFDLTVPGGAAVPMAGTTVVTVQPTHRRRGVLTEMMTRHLDQVADNRQPIAGLWASDERIYRRFGYGPAAFGHGLAVNAERADFPSVDPALRLRFADGQDALVALPAVHARVCAQVPGMFARTDAFWAARHFRDPESGRGGASARRHVVVSRGGEDLGYVAFRQRQAWGDDNVANGAIEIIELVAVEDEVRRSLWAFLATVDLFPNITWWNMPVDDPLPYELGRFRLATAKGGDSLWLRIVDVAGALAARRYERDGGVTIEVVDALRHAGGRYRLEVTDGEATVVAAAGSAEVQLDVADLGSLYLGGVSATGLARAGRITGGAEAVARLDDLFRTRRAPWCPEIF